MAPQVVPDMADTLQQAALEQADNYYKVVAAQVDYYSGHCSCYPKISPPKTIFTKYIKLGN